MSYEYLVTEVFSGPGTDTRQDCQRLLNSLGEEGWDLVWVAIISITNTRFFLKRPLPSQTETTILEPQENS